MKKILLLLLWLCLFIPTALADQVIELPFNVGGGIQILTDGQHVHILGRTYTYKEEPLGNGQYFNSYEEQIACYALNEMNELEPCQNHCIVWCGEPNIFEEEYTRSVHYSFLYVFTMCPQYGVCFTQYADGVLHLYRWCPDGDDTCVPVADIPLAQFGVQIYDEPDARDRTTSSYHYAFHDSTFYIAVDLSEGIFTKYEVYAYDLESGNIRKLYKTGFEVTHLYPADNQQILVETLKEYVMLNTLTGEARGTGVKGYPDLPVTFVPDGQGGFYFLGLSGIYHYDQDMKYQLLYSLPAGPEAVGPFIYRPETHDFIFTAYNKKTETSYLYIIDEDRSQQNALTLIDFSNDLGTMTSYAPSMEEFHAAHPQCSVVVSETISDYDQLNQSLVLGGDNFDVMLLDANLIDLPNLYKKGYFADLSDMEAIQTYVASAYPVFRGASMMDGKIAALPLVASDNIIMVNEPLWKELGLPIPATYGELLDTIAQCLDEGILNDYPLFKSDRYELDSRGMVISWDLMAPTESYNTLWHHLLQSYIGTSLRKGELTFQDDTITTLMAQLRAMKDKLDEHDARRVVGDALLYPYGKLTYVSGLRLYDQEAFRPLLLGVHDAEDIAVPVRLKVMLINPRSPRIDLAKEYLAYFAAHPTSTTRCVITTEQPDGIEKPGSDVSKESDAGQIESMEASIEAARTEGDLATVRDLEEQLAQFKENRSFSWDVTPDAAQMYYQITPYMVVMDNENFQFVEENGSRDIAAFDEGRIDAKTLCQRLEQLLQMRRMENQ